MGECGFGAASRVRTMSVLKRPAWLSRERRVPCGRCAWCPSGWKKARELDVPSGEIGLVHGEPAEFRFFSSAVRKEDQPGTVLERWSEDELTETAPLTATLPADESVDEPYVPVRFQSRITELGMFELWCVSTTSEGRWKLEFNVREDGED